MIMKILIILSLLTCLSMCLTQSNVCTKRVQVKQTYKTKCGFLNLGRCTRTRTIYKTVKECCPGWYSSSNTLNCVRRGITGHATCDNKMSFYADGVLKVSNNDWTKSSPVNIPTNTQVVAVKCVDLHVVGGIKVALSNGVKTDTTWKCSSKYEYNWNKPGFDDSKWLNAVKPTFNWGTRPSSLNGKADWIWTSGWRGQDKTVYCRKTIRKVTDKYCDDLKRRVAYLTKENARLRARCLYARIPGVKDMA